MPLLIGITAVMAALGLVALPSQLLPVDTNLPAVILLIGLAVGVDYSLFYLRREREERAAGRSERVPRSRSPPRPPGRAVLISGLTVIVAMAGMFISGDKTFISFAEGAILVVAIAMFASLTVLPAMLSWLGDRVEKGRDPAARAPARGPAGSRASGRALIDRVMRAPGLSIVLAGGLLVALAIPALQMKVVTSGVDDLPQDLPIIKTYNKVKAVFPTEGVDGDRGRRGRRRALRRRRRRHHRPARRGRGLRRRSCPEPRSTTARTARSPQIDVPTPGSGNDAASDARPERAPRRDHPGDGRRGRRARRVNVTRRRGQLGGLRQISSRAGCR